jgi:hypothetical protein
LFEFEDQSWSPNEVRKGLISLIIRFNKMMKVDQPMANTLLPLPEKQG